MSAEAQAALTREIADAGRGLMRLVRYDPSWEGYFEQSATGFLRSFFAPALALPFYLVAAGIVSGAGPQAEDPTLREVAAIALSHLIATLGYPALVAAFARPLGVSAGYAGFIIVANWSTLFLNIALAATAFLTLGGDFGYALFSLCWLVIFAFSMFVVWRAARETLSTEVAPAVLMVVLMVAVSVAADQVGAWIVKALSG